MIERITEASTSPRARAIGVVYLLYFLTAFLAAFLTKGLVVSGNAAATANNILAHEPLYRSGLAVDLIANALYIVLTALFYWLFEPVDRGLSLLAAFFSLVGCAIQIFGSLFRSAPLIVLGDNPFLSVFTSEQLQATALLCFKLYAQVFHVSFVCFALYDLLIGYLIVRSTFLPRILGVLLMCGGVGWLTFLWPPLAISLASYILLLGGLAELFLMLWLLVKGVNVSRWREKAGARHVRAA
jgi:Domain of unknown function (DUF4386)